MRKNRVAGFLIWAGGLGLLLGGCEAGDSSEKVATSSAAFIGPPPPPPPTNCSWQNVDTNIPCTTYREYWCTVGSVRKMMFTDMIVDPNCLEDECRKNPALSGCPNNPYGSGADCAYNSQCAAGEICCPVYGSGPSPLQCETHCTIDGKLQNGTCLVNGDCASGLSCVDNF